MHFFHSIWKNLHLTENFYTGTACGACDKYWVCSPHISCPTGLKKDKHLRDDKLFCFFRKDFFKNHSESVLDPQNMAKGHTFPHFLRHFISNQGYIKYHILIKTDQAGHTISEEFQVPFLDLALRFCKRKSFNIKFGDVSIT